MFTVKFVVFTGVFLGHVTFGNYIFLDNFIPFINSTWREAEREEAFYRRGKTCETEVCKTAAKNILDGLDPDVDPCEDFYSFACGGWIKTHGVPLTENHWNQFDIMDRKLDSQIHQLLADEYHPEEPEIVKTAKRVYKVCMNVDRREERGITPLVNFLEELYTWPMTTSNWDSEKKTWQELMGDVERKLAISTIFFVYVDVDRKNTSRNLIIVDEPNLEVPKYMLEQGERNFILAYINYIINAAELVAKARGETIYLYNLHFQAVNVFRFEMELARIIRAVEGKRSAEDGYHLTTIGDLQNWTDRRFRISLSSKIDWLNLFRNILGDDGKKLTNETEVAITSWKFLGKVIDLIDITPRRIIADYIVWRVVQKLSRDVNYEMLDLNFEFKKAVAGISQDYPRWRDCVATTNYLSFVVGYMYVQKHFTDEAKVKAIEMVQDIRSAFRQQIMENPWMDQVSKREALEKAEVMKAFIGYPDWFDNITYLEEYYKGIEIGDDHFENKVKLRDFIARKLLDNLDEESNREEWLTTPAIANAYYNPHLNSIIFPAGVLQDPFFNKDQPEALNYGSIGTVVGHEITHAFDNMGRQSDKQGNIKQWWTKDTENAYQSNAFCFSKQYGNYRIPELDGMMNGKATVNGYRTLDENIADNGGLNAALRAYLSHLQRTDRQDLNLPGLEHYSHEQLFYIGFAQVWCESYTTTSLLGEVLEDAHSPHRFRVTGSLSNSKHFSSTWQCPLGSKMNPKEKCQLW